MTTFTIIADIVIILEKVLPPIVIVKSGHIRQSAITTLRVNSTNLTAVTTGVSLCFKFLFIFSTKKIKTVR